MPFTAPSERTLQIVVAPRRGVHWTGLPDRDHVRRLARRNQGRNAFHPGREPTDFASLAQAWRANSASSWLKRAGSSRNGACPVSGYQDPRADGQVARMCSAIAGRTTWSLRPWVTSTGFVRVDRTSPELICRVTRAARTLADTTMFQHSAVSRSSGGSGRAVQPRTKLLMAATFVGKSSALA